MPPTPDELIDVLRKMPAPQFKLVVVRMKIGPGILHGAQADQAIELTQWAELNHKLPQLQKAIEEHIPDAFQPPDKADDEPHAAAPPPRHVRNAVADLGLNQPAQPCEPEDSPEKAFDRYRAFMRDQFHYHEEDTPKDGRASKVFNGCTVFRPWHVAEKAGVFSGVELRSQRGV